MSGIIMNDHTEEILADIKEAIERGLEKVGMSAEAFAKANITKNGSVDTGNLRNSITYKVVPSEKAAYIGTNVEYGKYVELGTGKYASTGGGRQTPWVYQDANGDWHRTSGQQPKPFLKPAATEHQSEYAALFKSEFENG